MLTFLPALLVLLVAAVVPQSASARPADRVVVQTVTASRAGDLVVAGVLVRNRGDGRARGRKVRVDALSGGAVVASRRAALPALHPGRTLGVSVTLAVAASLPAVRLRACVASRCRRGPVVSVAPDARTAAPAGTTPTINRPSTPAPVFGQPAVPAPIADPQSPGPQPPDPQPLPDNPPQPDPPPSGPPLNIEPATKTIDRGETVHFSADAADVEWDLDGDGSFDDADGAEAEQRFVRSGDVRVRARTSDGERSGTSTITIRYPGGPLPWRDEVTSVQQDASHTGYQPSGDPAAPLARRWSVSFDGAALGAPIIAGGRIFVLVGTFAPALVALDPATGGRLWERPVGAIGGNAVLSYDAGQVLVETSDHLLQVFDAASGETVAARSDVSQNPGAIVAHAGLVVAGETWPVRAFRLPDLQTAWTADGVSEEFLLSAIDRADVFTPGTPCAPETSFDLALGERQWSNLPPGDSCGGAAGWAAVYDGLVFSNGDPGVVRRARDGAFVRNFHSEWMPAFAGDRVLVANGGGPVCAQSLREGTPLWCDSAVTARPPLIVGDRVYVVHTDGLLVQLDLASGAPQWSEQLPLPPPGHWADGWSGGDSWSASAAAEGVLLTTWRGTLTAFEHAGAARPAAQQPIPPASLDPAPEPLLPADAPAPRGGFDRSAGSATGLGRTAPTLLWQTPVLGPVGDAIAVAGRIYAVTNIGYESVRTLRAFDALTGLQLWSRTGSGIGYEVVYGGGRLYTHAGHPSTDGNPSTSTVTAYDALTGLERWSRTFVDPYPARDGVVYDAGSVYVGRDKRVSALDASDGDVLWDVASGGNGDYPMALHDGLLVRTLPCGVETRRLSDGQLAWQDTTCTGGGGGDVAIAGGHVYSRVSSGLGGLYYNLADGAVKGSVRSTAQQAFGGGVGVQVIDDGLQAIDLASGRRRWLVPHIARNAYQAQYGGILAPAVTRDQVVFGISRELHGYDLDSGAERWNLTLPTDTPRRDPFGLVPSLNVGDGLLLVPLVDRLAVYGSAVDLPDIGLPLP